MWYVSAILQVVLTHHSQTSTMQVNGLKLLFKEARDGTLRQSYRSAAPSWLASHAPRAEPVNYSDILRRLEETAEVEQEPEQVSWDPGDVQLSQESGGGEV